MKQEGERIDGKEKKSSNEFPERKIKPKLSQKKKRRWEDEIVQHAGLTWGRDARVRTAGGGWGRPMPDNKRINELVNK